MKRLLIAGIGGFGRGLIEALLRNGHDAQLIGAVDDAPSSENRRLLAELSVDFVGPSHAASSFGAERFLIAIADPKARSALHQRFSDYGMQPEIFVDQAATTCATGQLGPGTVVMAGAVLGTSVTTGLHAHVHYSAMIGHDTVLRDFSTVFPLAAVAGYCTVEDGATIGVNATVLPSKSIGRFSFVGAGSVVTRDVLAGTVVTGVPAR